LPPTPTQFEVPIVFSEAEGHPIVFDSFLLGGSHEQKWIDNVEAAQKIKGGEVYKLYDNTGYIGLGIGSSVPIYDIGPYAEFIDVTHENENFYQLAISADWDAMPRKMLPIEDVEPIRKILADYLVGQKGLNTKIVVSQCYSIDFAGNGVQRVVVSANSINTDYYEIFAGDFSLVAVIDPDKKITILFEDIWYEGIDEWRGETRRFANISSVADLNGDGVMEFIMKWEYYEGIVYEAYSIYNSETTLVLINGLGA
jgi:hypothetical protein